jgi:tellurite resistance protein TerC
MFEPIEIEPYHWVGFIVVILACLALDLGVFHKRAHVVKFREALGWTAFWFAFAMLFGLSLVWKRNREEALEFITGYLIELSLSMDNVFVIALIFAYFQVPLQFQHRVLFWGILGALIMRGIMIGLGVALILRFHWMLPVFGVVLLIAGAKMVLLEEKGVHPEKNPFIRAARRLFPIAKDFDGQNFVTIKDGKWSLTPLVPVLLMVETTDLIFALDSIPAIFGITQKPFIVFTSNVFAILGLRSLYFVLAGALEYFRYLKPGLAAVLIYIGAKMVVAKWVHVPALTSLVIVAAILLAAILVSILAARQERRLKIENHPKKGGAE